MYLSHKSNVFFMTYCTFFVAFLLLCEIIRNFEPPNVLKENMNFLFVSLIILKTIL